MADAYLKVRDNGPEGLSVTREETDVSISELGVQLNRGMTVTPGYTLRATADGIGTEWAPLGAPTDAQTAQAVSDWLDAHPEATTTVQDHSLTMEKMVNGTLGFVTPEMYGAAGDGETDDTTAVQAAIDANRTVRFTRGRTYLVTSPLVVGDGGTVIDGNGAKIIYSKEQSATPSHTESLFVIIEKDDVTVKDLCMVYDGTFTVSGDYGGYIFGIYVDQSDRFTAEGLEISGFNNSGIYVGESAVYCENPKIVGCYLHHNRVSGVLFGYTDNGLVCDCRLTYNGAENSIGTGYGFAGSSGGMPKNTIIANNFACDNYRKGIDFHAGNGGLIIGNVCARNRCFGIFVCVHIHGSWVISGNTVTEMTLNSMISGIVVDKAYAILVGGDDTSPDSVPTSFAITGNVIDKLNRVDGSLGVFGEEMSDFAVGKITISGNIVDVGTIDWLYRGQNLPDYVDGFYFDVVFEGNQVRVQYCKEVPFYIRSKQNRQKVIQNNIINIVDSASTNGFYTYDASSVAKSCSVFSGNVLNIPEGTFITAIGPILVRRLSNEIVKGNVINGIAWREWDGFAFTDRKSDVPDAYYWTKGSIVWNTNPATSVGWVCTAAGTPGTWEPFGAIVS